MRKGEYNKEVLRLQQLLGRKLRLHAESELRIRFNVERDKVLCDLLLHQEFFGHLCAALAKHVDSDPCKNAAAGSDSATTLQDLLQAGAAADASSSDADPTWLHQQLPESYVARLLRQATLQQVHQVLQMTRQDWVDFWTDTMQQLLLLLEIYSRSEYNYDAFSTDAAASGLPGSTAEDAVLATASRAPAAAPPSAAQQQRWSLREQPLHTSAAANRELLWQALDSKMQLVHLAHVLHLAQLLDPVPHISTFNVCLVGGAEGQPSRKHWEAVADRLQPQLSPMQEMHWSICLTEYKRMQAATRSEGVNLLQTAQQPTLQVAAALQQQQQQQQQQQGDADSSRHSRTAENVQQGGAQEATTSQQGCPDATQPAASLPRPLAQQLQNHVTKRLARLWCTEPFLVNTLTRHQLALILVASFPYVPSSFTLAEIVCSRVQQRMQQQLRELEKGASRKSSAASRKAALVAQVGAGKGRAGASDDHARGGQRVPYSQWLREQHDHERAAELLLHQHHCWSQLDRLQHLH